MMIAKRSFLALALAVVVSPASAQTKIGDRFVTAQLAGSSCSNVAIEKLGGQDRTASACEIEFDGKVRAVLREALGPALEQLQKSGWIVDQNGLERDLITVHQGMERGVYARGYAIYLSLSPALQAPLAEKSQRVMDQLSGLSPEASLKALEDLQYEVRTTTKISLTVGLNQVVPASTYFFKAAPETLSLPGTVFAVRGSHVGALSGGGDSSSVDAAVILLGKAHASLAKDSSGTLTAHVNMTFPARPPALKVQSIGLHIEAATKVSDGIIARTNFRALAAAIEP